ncbi:MAG: cytochrome P450 [Alphaproteobacteria bacterium]|nr:cytochrome P450 [Alphaproteobacteria bacterium]
MAGFRLKYPVPPGPVGWHLAGQDLAQVRFRLERLEPGGIGARLFRRLVLALMAVAVWWARMFGPTRVPVVGVRIMARHHDVMAVLGDPARYPVPFGPEMILLAHGPGAGDAALRPPFMLGTEGPDHASQRALVESAMAAGQGWKARFMADTTAITAALLANADGQIDVMKDVFARVTAQTGADYLGLAPPDIDAYSDWTLAMSAMLFGDPAGSDTPRELAQHAGWRLRGLIDAQLAGAVAALAPLDAAGREGLAAARGLMWALAATKMAGGPALGPADHALIRSIITGLAIGLGPTTTLAGGKAFDWLLRHPGPFEQAVAAATTGNRDALRRIALEACRMAPALDPGQFRNGPDGPVLAATAAAMHDPRIWSRPGRFDPDRWIGREHEPNLMFGHGLHNCIGQYMSIEQMTGIMAELFAQPGLMRAGKTQFAGVFPRRLDVRYGPAIPAGPAAHAMITLNVPVLRGVDDPAAALAALEADLMAFGNPAGADVRDWLDGLGIVHFLSINVLDVGTPASPDVRLLIEISADGAEEPALAAIFAAPPSALVALFARVCNWDERASLARFLHGHRLDVRPRPWGATGLLYNGSTGHSMAMKRRRHALAGFARRALDHVQASAGGSARPALADVAAIRAMLADPANAPPHLAHEAAALRPLLFVPGRQRLPFVNFQWPGFWGGVIRYLASRSGLWIVGLFLLPGLVTAAGLWALLAPGLVPIKLLLFLVIMLVSSAVLWGLALLGVQRWLNSLESSDAPDTRDPDLARRLAIAARENAPGHEQSHIISCSDFKPGILRRFTFAFAMWGIRLFATYYTRSGFILTMGTIHFARWLRLPDAERLIFFSNYDGTWESYLEDFITKAHEGQTAAWSHGIGFPPARNLIGEGAKNGDLFKRWVRRQQRLTHVWYSALPDLTLDRIRAQALIHHGLARTADDAAAQDLLSLLGSAPRPADMVDTAQVQSIVFRAMGSLVHGAHIFLRLPAAAPNAALARLIAGEADLPPITFGDLPSGAPRLAATASLALSAAGLSRLGLPGPDSAHGLASFPLAFMAGMPARATILGDPGDWDAAGLASYDAADACLILACDTPQRLAGAIAAVQAIVPGAEVIITGPSGNGPDPDSLEHDHFGFRDGISQPVIRHTGDWRRRPATDQMAAGELLLGHPSNQGYVAPPLRLESGHDPLGLLPAANPPARPYPDFTPDDPPAFRDFGRNGSFLVVRRLAQNVEGFAAGTAAAAADLNGRCPHLAASIGQAIDGPWVAAKIIGRWPDGTPLIDRAGPAGTTDARNDFSFAAEDPQGLACPLGSHIRRANPRDGLDIGDPESLATVNRHRLVRRGRPYRLDGERGLMFTAICADIERQFEFVQQRWLNGPSFHGLAGEIDPLLGQGAFTVPTATGPVRLLGLAQWVTLKGGGYFFLPGRAALRWLAQPR